MPDHTGTTPSTVGALHWLSLAHAHSLSFYDSVNVDIHYGTKMACWIGNGMSNLVAFGLPISLILCSNAVLFSLTVAGIQRTRRASERMNITQGQCHSVRRANTDLVLYLKVRYEEWATFVTLVAADLGPLSFMLKSQCFEYF